MCGIAGLVNNNNSLMPDAALKNLANSMFHRGPDNQGIYRFENVSLVHTRLSIIDLTEAGNQPFHFNEYSIIFNGEIYNFLELRNELTQKGVNFQTNSDVEVVIKYIAIKGLASVEKFNGMFAIAVLDRRERKIHLIRDRIGIKPLFYSTINGNLYFASEQKAFYAFPEFIWQLDHLALSEYLLFQNVISFKTLDKNIMELPPGTIMSYPINSSEGAMAFSKYYNIEICTDESMKNQSESSDLLASLISDSVERQLLSDVEIGCFLSGGVDSGSIAAQVAVFNSEVKTFTIGFKGLESESIAPFDESAAVLELLENFQFSSNFEFVSPENFEMLMVSTFNAISEPRVGQSYPNFAASQLAAKNLKVALSGTGGDELFAGYPWRYFSALNGSNFNDFKKDYFQFWCRILDVSSLSAIKIHEGKHGALYAQDLFMDLVKPVEHGVSKQQMFLNSALEFEMKTFLRGLLLIEDQISMANSLETRVPLLDNHILDFALKCPVSWKFDFEQIRGKVILGEAMSKLLPIAQIERSKRGFTGPDELWFRTTSKNLVQRKLLDRKSNIFEILEFEPIARRILDHFSGKENNRLLIWSLLSLEHYFNTRA